MKLRIKGNSLRLRTSRSETSRLIQAGRIEETIRFASGNDDKLTYALEHSGAQSRISVRYQPGEVIVILPTDEARRWAESDQVGLYCDLPVGNEVLAILIEKDFACLDGSDADNEDTFENPNQGSVC